jgi:hypothetical protein
VGVEIVREKNTVKGPLAPAEEEYGMPFRPMHGNGSATTRNELAVEVQASPPPMVELYLGDRDPNGWHMRQVDAPRRLTKYGGRAIH